MKLLIRENTFPIIKSANRFDAISNSSRMFLSGFSSSKMFIHASDIHFCNAIYGRRQKMGGHVFSSWRYENIFFPLRFSVQLAAIEKSCIFVGFSFSFFFGTEHHFIILRYEMSFPSKNRDRFSYQMSAVFWSI